MINRLLLTLHLCCSVAFLFGQGASSGSTSGLLYIKAGKLFDSEKGQFAPNRQIIVEGDRIREVGANLAVPAGARVIDLSAYTLIPGLIDAHTHLLHLETLDGNLDIPRETITQSDALRALRGAARARTFLEAGITTVKDLGNSGQFLDVALKRGIEEGSVEGPRMFVSGPILSSEGGQAPGLAWAHRHLAEAEYRVVRSPDDARQAVRENITYGADLIKICAENTPNNTTLTVEEMRAIVDMAHRYGRKVTAHATGDRSAYEAVLAGVDGIEHGYRLEDSTLALMASRQVPLIPTDIDRALGRKVLTMNKFEGDMEAALDNWSKGQGDRIRRARKAGVMIVAGSDNYIDFQMPQGEAAKHVLLAYQESGMTPAEVLQAATWNSARFLGNDRLGVIRAGALADLVAVQGDLETDFAKALFDVVWVMKGGKVAVDKEK